MMKVIFNIEPIKFPLTGIGRYTYHLALSLQESKKLENLYFMNMKSIGSKLLEESSIKKIKQSKLKTAFIETIKKNYYLSRLAIFALQKKMGHTLKSYKDYLYHGTNFYLPHSDCRKVATIHDISFITMPECHLAVNAKLMTKLTWQSIKIANHLITVSEFSKQEIIDVMGCPAEKISVTPLAASQSFKPQTQEQLQSFLNSYNLNYQGYSLFVGTLEPRKNIDLILKTYERLPNKLRLKFPLVICGFQGWKSAHLYEKLVDYSRQGWVKYYGFMPNNELPKLMAGARLFTFPSWYEGFGLPPLEAMQSGVPVLASNRSSLPEVVGQAGVSIDPDDDDQWLEWVKKGLEDQIWREQAIEKGLKQAMKFSWVNCAENTLKAYEKAYK